MVAAVRTLLFTVGWQTDIKNRPDHSGIGGKYIMTEEKDEGMRLDKFLKVSRLIKRRTVAADAADAGRITINDRVAKPSSKVHPGDIIEIGFGNRTVKARVKQIINTTKKENVSEMFEYL